MNQISLASLMMHLNMTKEKTVDEGMVRHMILNSIRLYRNMFKEKYGEVILTYDSKHYWRRDYFPQYKMNRKKARENDSKDWDNIFGVLNKIKAEFKEYLPYKYLEVYGAEADDIIGTLCKQESEPVMIVSGDKDFIQLHKYENVKQYSPILKKHVNGHNPDTYIRTHILKGDTSDGVPNVLSPDITFTEGLRQRPLGKKKIETWLESMDSMPDEAKRNYQRNEKLINLDKIPQELEEQILSEIDEAPHGDRSKLLNYFIDNKLKELTESIGDF
jgi:5'-3' exonuclease|tara:strand:+ start:460 stop:1281 length:822 start_codon:yes stop_codon:yes gene_type:complete